MNRAHPPAGMSVSARVKLVEAILTDAEAQPALAPLASSMAAHRRRLTDILAEASNRPDERILLVGTTGAGKSTLLNALLDHRVLPVSNMRACTAAIAEIGFAESRYSVEIEFVTREEWLAEEALLRADLKDAGAAPGPEAEADGGEAHQELSRSAKQKLAAVYGVEGKSLDSRLAGGQLELPPEIAEAFNRGKDSLECAVNEKPRVIKFIRKHLSSDDRFWPIVKRLRIRGPFEVCRDGATLVDLPGINDPNEARERVTKEHLRTARFVWIVFRMTRSLTKDITELLETNSFLRDLVMDGRTDALTFVGTASDEFDELSLAEELGLFGDYTPAQLADLRNASIREQVRQQLEDIWVQLERRSGIPVDPRAAERRRKFVESKVFTVSAKEFERLSRGAKVRVGPFDTIAQTELPRLVEHMQQAIAEFGQSACDEMLHRRLDALVSEIQRDVASRQAAARRRQELSADRRRELEGAAAAADRFLDERLRGVEEMLARDLEAAQSHLLGKVAQAMTRAESEVLRFAKYWGQIHWATLRAIARRRGVFQNARAAFDLPNEVAGPVLDHIAFDWTDFFNDRLRVAVRDDHDRLLQAVADHADSLLSKVHALSGGAAPESGDSRASTRSAREFLDHRIATLERELLENLTTVQRTLRHTIPDCVRESMGPAFDAAGQEQGAGMRDRMVARIVKAAEQAARDMMGDARERIVEGITGTAKRVRTDHAEWEREARRYTTINAQNYRVGGEHGDARREASEIESLQTLSDRFRDWDTALEVQTVASASSYSPSTP